MTSYTYYTEDQIIETIKNSFKVNNGKTKCLKKGDNFFTVTFHNDGSYFSFEYCEEGLTKMFYKNGKISGSITNGTIIETLINKIFMELEVELREDTSGEKRLEFEIHNKIVELAFSPNMMEG